MLKGKAASSTGPSTKGGNEAHLTEVIGQDVMLAEDVWDLFKVSHRDDQVDSGPIAGSPTPEPSNEIFLTDVFVHDSAQVEPDNQPESTLDFCAA